MAAPDYDRSFLADPTAERADIVVSQIHRILSGGPPTADSPYDKREIKVYYLQVQQELQGEIDRLNAERLYKDAIERQVFNKATFFEDLEYIYKYGGTTDDHIISLLDWPVLFDSSQGQYYSLLPASYTDVKRYRLLPGEEQIKAVAPMLERNRRLRRYIPLMKGQERLIPGLEGNYGFYREGPLLYYYGVVPDKTLKIDYVLRPERDLLPAPGLLLDAQDDVIIPRVVALIMRKMPQDLKNDNNPNL